MTKTEFQKFYHLFTVLVKQTVNEEYVMNASAHLIDYCGGYELELHPECLMWGDEMSLINSLCRRFALSFEIHLSEGALIIR